jgi:PIN domain nuclease of toxin-antitoxin system
LIVLDTHAWIWWLSDPHKIPSSTRELISEHSVSEGLYVSSISTWEVAMLVARGRLRLSTAVRDWISKSEALEYVRFVPVDNPIALRAVELPEPFHRDPADRMIVATALTMGAEIVTGDRKIQNYPHVTTVWD